MNDLDRGLIPALLKDWRRRRGLSQLDLAVAADVSARHISFIETGRSTPSREMVLLLGTTLGVPLRHIDTMLRAAGHEPVGSGADELPASITNALDLLARHHEPFPVIVFDRHYDLLRWNQAGGLLLATLAPGQVSTESNPLNIAKLAFDPDGAQPLIVNFAEVGRELLWRLHREVLADPADDRLRALLDEILEYPTIDPDWRTPDLAAPSDPALVVHVRQGDLDLRFLTMVTVFQAPLNAAVEHLRIETWLPADDATAELCALLASSTED